MTYMKECFSRFPGVPLPFGRALRRRRDDTLPSRDVEDRLSTSYRCSRAASELLSEVRGIYVGLGHAFEDSVRAEATSKGMLAQLLLCQSAEGHSLSSSISVSLSLHVWGSSCGIWMQRIWLTHTYLGKNVFRIAFNHADLL